MTWRRRRSRADGGVDGEDLKERWGCSGREMMPSVVYIYAPHLMATGGGSRVRWRQQTSMLMEEKVGGERSLV
jgi:hypothetical protein